MNPDQKNEFDWKHFIDNTFGKGFPFSIENTNQLIPDMEKIQDYVQELISKRSPKLNSLFPSTQSPEVFETHKSVFVRIKVPKNMDTYNIRMFVDSSHVKLKNISSQDINIPLPTRISVRRSKANIKNGILEIRMPKSTKRFKRREIYLDDIY